jgi:hypothetical protein
MRKLLLFILLIAMSVTAVAQDAGLFFDPDRPGEGVNILKRDNMVSFTFFSYVDRCLHRSFDDEAFIEDKAYNWCRKQQIWYISGQHPLVEGQATGPIYTANPYEEYEEGELADVVDVGIFFLTKTATGYRMVVLQTGDVLDPDAAIFHTTFDFSQYLFGSEHIAPAD